MHSEGFFMGPTVSAILSIPTGPAEQARCADKAALAVALSEARSRTLALFAAYEAALGPGLQVPCTPELNPPRWELGHIAWFADWWIARNPERPRGLNANPHAPRHPARQARRGVDADSLFNSSTVAHDLRWALPLPNTDALRADLAASLQDTLALLQDAEATDTGLYFFRLALFHEDMHAEAAVYMAQNLGLDLGAGLGVDVGFDVGVGLGFDVGFDPGRGSSRTDKSPVPHTPLAVPATAWQLGRSGPGFAFDNELGAHTVAVDAFEIDAQAVTWAQYLPFVDSGAADQREHWSDAGWAWRQSRASALPRYLRRGLRTPLDQHGHPHSHPNGHPHGPLADPGWEQLRHGQWQPLNLAATACHLTAFEAQAWCHWAGRRLPTEAEWEVAAHTLPGFAWGTVWEWTASAFAPFPGFVPHPYVDYSAPWFDGRPVLKGASTATVPRMRHPKYRNYFTPERNDIVAGFRSVVAG
jgi:gamma-glutamyl hercynylcysteine S-oxide synthase